MKVIDLLNKIANGEEVPKKIKYETTKRTYNDEDKDYTRDSGELGKYYLFENIKTFDLNDEVEIIEEHKIPEKINWREKESMAGNLTKDKQIEVIARRTEHLKKSINEILDYLEEIE